ncbi:MAG: NAD(P)/FAD-dependent oxidoreductase [Betaproteobacteria bacterium]|nr:NAD(P)/FAD-dependent oxidoreductase [Betaproteobacteria bacterium]
METVDTIVIGAGVVGLAIARELAMAGREVIMLEAADGIGTETSSRNSEVIHAGIYYDPGSVKAAMCVAGKRLLYDFCRSHGVPHVNCGKLIVATTNEQIAQLEKIHAQAAANGVNDLRAIPARAAMAMEAALHCVAALHSPSTGIIDSHAFMLALLGDAEAHGAMLVCKSPVLAGAITDAGIELSINGADPMRIRAQAVVNAAGLHAQSLAGRISGFPSAQVPPTHYCKGNYYTLIGRSPFSRLIYPVPEAAGLGVHVTIDLAGQARFGPDVEWIDAIDYRVDPRRADSFYAAIRTYWPDLKDGALQPGYAGIRPKLQPQGAPGRDFVISVPGDHGVRGLVNLFGIESPGLTAALAIARYVRAMLHVS